MCIVLKSIYNNLIALRSLVEIMCECLFNVQYFSWTRSRSNSRFFRGKSFNPKKRFGTDAVLQSMKHRVSFDEFRITNTINFSSVRIFPQDLYRL